MEVRTTGRAGYLYEGNSTRGVALATEVSDELLLEGLVRERHGAYIRREVLVVDVLDLDGDEALRRGHMQNHP